MRLGTRQLSALQLLVFDVAHVEWREMTGEGPPPVQLDGALLTWTNADDAWAFVVELANGCDDIAEGRSPGDQAEARKDRDALSAIASKIIRGAS